MRKLGESLRDVTLTRIVVRGASSRYVADTLEAALWCVHHAADFREAILLAANLRDDADTVAAVTDQLAGAIWGGAGILENWLARQMQRSHDVRPC
jgi:ADP-ribosyl-[dinitrogen reductase] hydrolase